MINILNDIPQIGHRELKNRIEQQLRRKISPTTFSKHLKGLDDKGLIKKEDHGVGKRTNYSLTELALKKISLGLLGNDEEKSRLLKRVYSMLFFYDIYRLPKVTTSY